MFGLRRFFRKTDAFSDFDTASDDKLPLYESPEKALQVLDHAPSPASKPCTRHKQLFFIVKLLFLAGALVIAFFVVQPILNHAALGYNAILRSCCSPGHVACGQDPSLDKPTSFFAPPVEDDPVGAKLLDRKNWTCESSSNSSAEFDCKAAIQDGDEWWKSGKVKPGAVHWMMIDMKQNFSVHSLAMGPGPGAAEDGGRVQKHRVEISTDKKKKWELVALGTWEDSTAEKLATFEPRLARFVNITVIDTTRGANFVEIGSINIYAVDSIPSSPAVEKGGRWGITLDFPLVPVTAFVNPISHNLTTMAANDANGFGTNNPNAKTISATWDPKQKVIESFIVGNSGQEMFCPGTSLDENGGVILTGGSNPANFTIYDPTMNKWIAPKDKATGANLTLKIPRGYHGQTFLPSGKTFIIGGTWSGDGVTPRDGELYDPKTGTWTVLSGVKAEKINMTKASCPAPYNHPNCANSEWQEHHPWLYAWRDDTVFHAGPSKQMNWIFTTSVKGDIKAAGLRKDKNSGFTDGDAVCGIAAMYDAAQGIILTAGGAPNYHYWVNTDGVSFPDPPHRFESTKNAFEIKLRSPGTAAETNRVASMKHQRIFANAVILPTGETFVVGGQRLGEPFHDETWEPIPEIYSPGPSPAAATWRDVARHSTPRPYHSWALLMPDATVVVGGGGLDRNRPQTNHYDAQIYEPGYLFKADGTAATRPKILSVDKPKGPYKVGEKIIFTTDLLVDTTASLIRYSSATHALNNDLRRIKLDVATEGAPANKKFSVTIPKDPGVALPGYWMLFVLQNGVPSVAQTIQVLAK